MSEYEQFLQLFVADLKQAAAARSVHIEADAISIAARSAWATAQERSIPNEATRKEAARRYVEKMIGSS